MDSSQEGSEFRESESGRVDNDTTDDVDHVPVVGIGASAGGVQALQALFQNIPAQTGMAFLVIVHFSPDRQSRLAEVLQAVSTIPVQEVRTSTRIEPDHVYVIPPGHYIEITEGELSPIPFDEGRRERAPIDHFFRTLAESRTDAIGVILSGGGADGAVGMKRLKERGGVLLVQDPDEAEYDSMPRSAIRTGLVDFIVPMRELAQKLAELHHRDYRHDRPVSLSAVQERALGKILSELNRRLGHDFAGYKRATVLRRVEHRAKVRQVDDLETYLGILKAEPHEADALLKDLLISVSNFFRDREAWEVLSTHVIPTLFNNKTRNDELRVWIAGGAKGEEAYSMAMLLKEHAGGMETPPRIKIFSSDINQEALQRAREGRYPTAISADVSEERLRHFFLREGSFYRVKEELRDLLLFPTHDLLRDPPFSHIDLISCRNLLIYLQHDVQEKVLDLFHYALRAGGFLFLGNSEGIPGPSNLFRPVQRGHPIYQLRPNEEYKSTQEGLRIDKEELQSVNEELHTVNAELKVNLDELGRLNNDLRNLIHSTDLATIFLDRQLKIERFTPAVRKLFNVRLSDTGRPLTDLAHRLVDYDSFDADGKHLLLTLIPIERETRDQDANWYLLRFLPYRTADDAIEGVVITFFDITRLKEAEKTTRHLASELVMAEERERRRIAELLHDNLQQQLLATHVLIRRLSRNIGTTEPASLKEHVAEIDSLLKDAMDQASNLAVDLSPPTHPGKNLASAVEWLAMHMNDLYGIEVDLEVSGNVRLPEENVGVFLLKIIRELLFNIVKHAGVDRAEIALRQLPDELLVQVSDRGKGFDPKAVLSGQVRGTRFGLPNVHERIRFLGGRLDIDSKPGGGTQVTITIPLYDNELS